MESHPQNPEFRISPENFHTCLLLHIFLSEGNSGTSHVQ